MEIQKVKTTEHWYLLPKPLWRRWMDKFDEMWWDFLGWKPMYWLRCHLFTRYHILDLRGYDGYRWGYIDPCYKMFLANFAILVDFIENEKPFDVIDYEAGGQVHIEKELRELYTWWKEGRKKEWDDLEKILGTWYDDYKAPWLDWDDSPLRKDSSVLRGYKDPRWLEYVKQREIVQNRDDEMLIRLIKIRSHLWT